MSLNFDWTGRGGTVPHTHTTKNKCRGERASPVFLPRLNLCYNRRLFVLLPYPSPLCVIMWKCQNDTCQRRRKWRSRNSSSVGQLRRYSFDTKQHLLDTLFLLTGDRPPVDDRCVCRHINKWSFLNKNFPKIKQTRYWPLKIDFPNKYIEGSNKNVLHNPR
jgi:hypothetical protein